MRVDGIDVRKLKQVSGRIVEGTHRRLVASGGYYASLVEKQTRGLLPMAA